MELTAESFADSVPMILPLTQYCLHCLYSSSRNTRDFQLRERRAGPAGESGNTLLPTIVG